MPYVGVHLGDCFPSEPASRASRHMADDGGGALKDFVRANTPIDTGHLRESWRQLPVRHMATPFGQTYRSSVETDVNYAIYVEHGTGLWGPEHRKYLIIPKKPGGMLHWVDRVTGQHVFAAKVMHPGSPGQHMMALGLVKTEALYEQICQPALVRWAHSQTAEFAAGQLKSPISLTGALGR